MTAAFLDAAMLAEITHGTWHNSPPEQFSHVGMDNRTLAAGGLFTALSGEHVDGHKFVSSLDSTAGQAAIVGAVQAGQVAQLLTPAPLDALQQIASYCADSTGAQKIAITGSVGKTGTKEMIAHILGRHGTTHASSGNYNNHIGLPLTLANMPDNCDFAVLEMGMNHAGEISRLSGIARPHIAAITCIADSHLGHFDTIDGIASAKSEIFDHLNGVAIAVLPKDDAFYPFLEDVARNKGAQQIISFGTSADADICMTELTATDSGLGITITCNNDTSGRSTHSYQLGMHAAHWAMNSLCALAVCKAAGIAPELACRHLADMQDLPGRGRRYQLSMPSGISTMIDDSYNAGPESMRAALADFARSASGQKTVILSDMLELGPASTQAHQSLIPYIQDIRPALFVAIGDEMSALASQLSADTACITTPNISALIDDEAEFSALAHTAGNMILIKGSHGSGAYRLAAKLRQHFDASQTGQQSRTGGGNAT